MHIRRDEAVLLISNFIQEHKNGLLKDYIPRGYDLNKKYVSHELTYVTECYTECILKLILKTEEKFNKNQITKDEVKKIYDMLLPFNQKMHKMVILNKIMDVICVLGRILNRQVQSNIQKNNIVIVQPIQKELSPLEKELIKINCNISDYNTWLNNAVSEHNKHITVSKNSYSCTECIICMENNTALTRLSCGHHYHMNCVTKCTRLECPSCRLNIKVSTDDVLNRFEKIVLTMIKNGCNKQDFSRPINLNYPVD